MPGRRELLITVSEYVVAHVQVDSSLPCEVEVPSAHFAQPHKFTNTHAPRHFPQGV